MSRLPPQSRLNERWGHNNMEGSLGVSNNNLNMGRTDRKSVV